MNDGLTPLVCATIARHSAQTRLDLERLRAAREATETVSRGGQSRALALGRRIRFLEKQSEAWNAVVAFTEDADTGFDERSVPDDDSHGAKVAEYLSTAYSDDTVTHPPVLIGYVAPDLSGFRCVDHKPQTRGWGALYEGSGPHRAGEVCGSSACTRKLGS